MPREENAVAEQICDRCAELTLSGVRAMICAACGRSFANWLNRRPGYDG